MRRREENKSCRTPVRQFFLSRAIVLRAKLCYYKLY